MNQPDIVFISDLQVDTVIGLYDWEREIRQTLWLDIEMATDIRKSAETDNIEFTLNYKAVSDRVIEYIAETEFLLVETLAERVVELIRSEFNVPWVKLRLSKPGAVPAARSVGVIIERGDKVNG